MSNTPTIDWHRAAPKPVALLFLPWQDGVSIVMRDASGKLYGCRDLTIHHPKDTTAAACVAAWISTESERGLTIEDHAGVVGTLLHATAQELTTAAALIKASA